MELQFAAAKIAKYATSESGDTLEMIERPHGGLSIVLADGQRSGRAAKIISNLAARKAIALLAEGVRDGAAARAAHDYLRTHRQGQVSATLNIVSLDLVSRSLVISRNSHCPVIVVVDGELRWLDEPSEAIGIHARTKPVITELSLKPYMTIVFFTDGVWTAGERYGEKVDLVTLIQTGAGKLESDGAQYLANHLLSAAIAAEKNRPTDDASVVVVYLSPVEARDRIRHMSVRFPV